MRQFAQDHGQDAIDARIASGHYSYQAARRTRPGRGIRVSYITDRHATAILRERGLIISIHGRVLT